MSAKRFGVLLALTGLCYKKVKFMDSMIFGLLIIGIVALFVLQLVMWIWMLVDCLQNEPSTGNDKVIWVLLMVFLGILGSLLYYFVRRPQRIEEFGH